MHKIFLSTLALSSVVMASHPFLSHEKSGPAVNEEVTPVGRFDTKNGLHLFVVGEAIMLQLTQDDLPYGLVTNYNSDTALAGQTYQTVLHHYKQMWHWGMRLTFGYNLPHDGWDIIGVYTRFYAHWNHQLNDIPSDKYLLSPVQGFSVNNDTVTDSSVYFNWQMKFNQWDVELGRNFYVSKYLRLRPLIGLRNLLVGQEFTTKVHLLGDVHSYQSSSDIHFWGMGVLAGINTFWNLNSNFSIYGNAKFASMYGYYSPHINDHIHNSLVDLEIIGGHEKTSKTSLDLALGIRWDKTFSDHAHFGIDVGFEQHTYYNFNKNSFGYSGATQYDGLSGRDLSLQGFTFGARLDF